MRRPCQFFSECSPEMIIIEFFSECSPERTSRTSSRQSPRSYFLPQELKVSFGGADPGGESYTRILQLKQKKNKSKRTLLQTPTVPRPEEAPTPVPISKLYPANDVENSRNFSTSFSMISSRPLNISITPPVLPLCFANALLMLYAVHETGVDCKLPLLGESRYKVRTLLRLKDSNDKISVNGPSFRH